MHKTTEIIKLPPLTLTFEPLPGEPPQQSPTVFAECGTLVVVDFKPVRHVNLEALLVDLQHMQQMAHGAFITLGLSKFRFGCANKQSQQQE